MRVSPTLPAAALPRRQRYRMPAIALHWLLGAAIVAAFCLGLYMSELPFSPQRIKLYNWHKWGGVTILFLSALRLLVRLVQRPPELPADIAATMPAWQRVVHAATHVGLYLFFFAVPLTGWAYSSAAGFSIVWFGVLPLPDFVAPDEALADALKETHEIAAFVLAALVGLHVAGVVKHRVIDRDRLMDRMLPGGA